jgi:hypothetical protein
LMKSSRTQRTAIGSPGKAERGEGRLNLGLGHAPRKDRSARFAGVRSLGGAAEAPMRRAKGAGNDRKGTFGRLPDVRRERQHGLWRFRVSRREPKANIGGFPRARRDSPSSRLEQLSSSTEIRFEMPRGTEDFGSPPATSRPHICPSCPFLLARKV